MNNKLQPVASMLPVKSVGGQSDGACVLFIHGFGADHQSWAGNVASVFKFAQALVVDLPGHGDSVSIPTGGSLSAIADNLLLSLDTDKPVHLVGHSIGASIATLCAAKQPDRIASLSLLAPAGLGVGVSRNFVDRFVRLENESEALQLLQTLVHSERLISPALASLVLNHLQQPGARESLKNFTNLFSGVVAEVAEAFNVIKNKGVRFQVFWGRQDRINGASQIDEQFIGGDWHWYDDTGHLLHVEQRVLFNQTLCQFLKE